MDSLILGLRVLLSLGAVFGLMWLAYRRLGSGGPALKARSLNVVARQTVGPKASVVLVDTDGKRFMLGVTEHGISVLHTATAPEPEPVVRELGQVPTGQPIEALTRRSARRAAAFEEELRKQAARRNGRGSSVAGSILDPGTWRLAAGTLRSGRQP
jgi:flagellar protein FliO/FliZ